MNGKGFGNMLPVQLLKFQNGYIKQNIEVCNNLKSLFVIFIDMQYIDDTKFYKTD